MFKHFIFGIFLTTLGLVTVMHALENKVQDAVDHFTKNQSHLSTETTNTCNTTVLQSSSTPNKCVSCENKKNLSSSPSEANTTTTSESSENGSTSMYIASANGVLPHFHRPPLRVTREDLTDIQRDVLNKINFYREKHQMPKLLIDGQISNYAQEWANTLAATLGKFEYRDENTCIYGENIHQSHDFMHVGEIAVDYWYYEIGSVHEDITEEDYLNNNSAKHLTQLLWKKTTDIGCGVAKYENDDIVVVVNFHPKRNVEDTYLSNLPRFTQAEIDIGKNLLENIEKEKNNSHTDPPEGQKKELPGWKSDLYSDKIINETDSQKTEENTSTSSSDQNAEIKPLNISKEKVESIRRDVIAKCNVYRQQHNMPELVLNDQINKDSQKWANELASGDLYQNSSTSEYGENIISVYDSKHVGEFAVDLWYYEIRFLNEDDTEEILSSNTNARGLTQLLWRESNQIGIGVAKYENNGLIIVARFYPKGNIPNLFLNNLPTFTQEEISEGKRLQGIIDALQERITKGSVDGGNETVTQWKSTMYSD